MTCKQRLKKHKAPKSAMHKNTGDSWILFNLKLFQLVMWCGYMAFESGLVAQAYSIIPNRPLDYNSSDPSNHNEDPHADQNIKHVPYLSSTR